MSGGLDQQLRALYETSDVPQMRQRLSEILVDRGVVSLAEYTFEERCGRSVNSHIWDTIESWTGRRRDPMMSAIHEIIAGRGPDDELRLLRWRIAQRRPYLTHSGASTRFRAFREFLNLYRDFGLRAVGTLVVPVPQQGVGARAVGAVVERENDLQNVPEAVALISAYCLKSGLHAAYDDRCSGADLFAPGTERAVDLTDKEREVLRWAAAGKTHQDIAVITGLSQRGVRYHLERARARYGFATTQQTIVRAALDYGFDPLG